MERCDGIDRSSERDGNDGRDGRPKAPSPTEPPEHQRERRERTGDEGARRDPEGIARRKVRAQFTQRGRIFSPLRKAKPTLPAAGVMPVKTSVAIPKYSRTGNTIVTTGSTYRTGFAALRSLVVNGVIAPAPARLARLQYDFALMFASTCV